jgi:histidinol phosphatase-like PHP family hydrolase
MYIAVTAMPDDESFVIGAEIQVVDDRDLDALDKMLKSFQLVTDDVADEA